MAETDPIKKTGSIIVANTATNCIMRVVSFVILVVIWGAAIFVGWKTNWFSGLSQNFRYIIIGAVFILPIIALSVIDYKLRKYFYRKL